MPTPMKPSRTGLRETAAELLICAPAGRAAPSPVATAASRVDSFEEAPPVNRLVG